MPETFVAAQPDSLAVRLVRYMELKGYTLDRGAGQVNIVYLEGSDADGLPNADALDGWNDRRLVLMFFEGQPRIVQNFACTTEPGAAPTFDAQSRRLGGVFRIDFGQHRSCWKMGFHKSNRTHPALVQAVPCIAGRRDANRDGKRTGDPAGCGKGVNQHGTNAGFRSPRVGNWSRGCMVARSWSEHIDFIELCRRDPRYIADKNFLFSATVIAGDEFSKTVV